MMRLGKSGVGGKVLLLALGLTATGSLNVFAAEHLCGSVSVDVVEAPVPGGSLDQRCGSAYTTCGTAVLTVLNEPVTGVRQYVAVRQRDGQFGPMIETNDCAKSFNGSCAWEGPPHVLRSGDQTIITQTLDNWTKKEDVGTFKRATLNAYCE
jgi:hypothetical protein